MCSLAFKGASMNRRSLEEAGDLRLRRTSSGKERRLAPSLALRPFSSHRYPPFRPSRKASSRIVQTRHSIGNADAAKMRPFRQREFPHRDGDILAVGLQ
mmetsp:Transcript_44737/g.136499  ORF Transcript_44737/g.136499 Transcript_44737/m.136499 type:complete len:99 (-) Transcript_44737:1194-1490(-)